MGMSPDGTSLRDVGRGLLTLDEVLRFPETHELIFLSGQPPLYAEKIPWHDAEMLAKKGATV